tara:strand:- start:828 stop:956 length:129 start_codon:yes stop_codon:yes gene_type:complete
MRFDLNYSFLIVIALSITFYAIAILIGFSTREKNIKAQGLKK